MLAVLIFGAVGHDLSLFLKNWWHIKCSCRCRCDLSQHLESVKFYMWTGGGKRLIKFLKSHYPTVILGPLGSLGARVLRPFNPASDRLFEEARRCDLSFDLISKLLWKWKVLVNSSAVCVSLQSPAGCCFCQSDLATREEHGGRVRTAWSHRWVFLWPHFYKTLFFSSSGCFHHLSRSSHFGRINILYCYWC